MTIECPSCRSRYRIDPGKFTKAVARIKCPKCAHLFQIEIPPPAPATAPPAAPKPAAAAPAAGTPPQAPARPRVLVVDDARFFRELVADVLRPLPVEVQLAADGVEALELIRRERPDLVILDLNLPRLDGYQLIREVRADPGFDRTRLLAMSGVFRKEEDASRAERSGADVFLSKSFTPEHLQQKVRSLLGIDR